MVLVVQLRKWGFLEWVLCCFILSSCKNSSLSNNEESIRAKEFQRCLGNIQELSDKRESRLLTSYKKIDPSVSNISAEHKTLFLKGSSPHKAVLILHGILSSPSGVKLLAEEFHKEGFTVLAPLIAGFGSSVKIANASSVESWRLSLDIHARMLSKCFSSFSLVGFSLGGALSTDFTLNRYPDLYKNKKIAQINSLLLLSPAIRPAENFVWLKANTTLIFTDKVPFWLISKLKNDPDINEMMKEPEKYNQHFPVYVGKQLHRLANMLEDSIYRFNEHPLAVSLDYSQADSATDWEETRSFLTDSFFDVRIFSYEKKENVPHSLFLRDKNRVGEQIRQGLVRFVIRYSQ